MGTRAGDMDPAVVLHLQTQLGLSVKEADSLLNKRSGLQGVCGQSDLRAVIEMAGRGEPRGALALDMFVYRIRKYIGAYMAALGGRVDAVVFSAGIGENSALARALICQGLQASVPPWRLGGLGIRMMRRLEGLPGASVPPWDRGE